ncbi:hypothetical protein LOC67_13960 [Stieleria sp. JC731]|uniref:N-acyl amino acid synthase FeeM domain-containing protein n=1 Tax=Pirellulaceae TaxID=2691357 RepID=UPI001E5BF783|nr:hypothetical protein [Stieleria sp. JC731]MCC9601659.1 hypothetical protein [Stieleria sp. JC731]
MQLIDGRPRLSRLRDQARQFLSTKVKVQQSVRCRKAKTQADLQRAEEFRQQRYQDVGLLSDSPLRTSPVKIAASPIVFEENEQWTANVFLAFRTTQYWYDRKRGFQSIAASAEPDCHEVICGTVTLLTPTAQIESPLNPTDQGSCLDQMKIGRVCRLAIEHESANGGATSSYRSVFLALTGLMHQTAIQFGLTHMDAIAHPRHAKLYRRIFNAVPIGEPFECQEVSGAPGQYMRADIATPTRFHERLRASYAPAG